LVTGDPTNAERLYMLGAIGGWVPTVGVVAAVPEADLSRCSAASGSGDMVADGSGRSVMVDSSRRTGSGSTEPCAAQSGGISEGVRSALAHLCVVGGPWSRGRQA
jgi:hypothetical protein